MLKVEKYKDYVMGQILPSEALGIECVVDNNKCVKYKTSLCSYEKSEFKVEFYNESQSLNDSITNPKRLPAVLIMTGPDIVVKKVGLETSLAETFPGIVDDQVKVQTYHFKDYKWIALAKASVLNQILEECQNEGIHVIDIHLSGVAITTLLDHFGLSNGERFGNHLFNWDNEAPSKYTYQFDDDKGNDELVPSLEIYNSQVVPAVLTLYYFLKKKSATPAGAHSEFKSFLINRIRKYATVSVSLLLLLMVVIAVPVKYYYEHQVEILNSDLARLRSEFQLDLADRDVLINKKQLEKELGVGHFSFTRWLEDIAKQVPAGVQLNSIELLSKYDKDQKRIAAKPDEDEIHIVGSANSLISCHEYFNQLQLLPWVSDLRMQDISPDTKSSLYKFQIRLLF